MQGNRQIQLLVAASVITLATLVSIQVYLICNTYKLHKGAYNQQLKEKINSITTLPKMEELMQENLKNTVAGYAKKRLHKDAVIEGLGALNAKPSDAYEHRLSQLLKDRFNIEGLQYSSLYDEIIVEAEGRTDTLLGRLDSPFLPIGRSTLPGDAVLLSRNTWAVNMEIENQKMPKRKIGLHAVVKQANYFWLSNWQLAIFRQMAGILMLAVGLIAAIIVLFYIIFHTMIGQKRLAAMKTDFANNITHELKTPLSSVGVILKSMKKIDQQKQVKIMQDLIDSMERQYAKIKRLIDNVLESTMGSLEIELKSIDMNAFLSKYAEDLWLDKHELKLDITLTQQCLSSNESALVRVLNILIDNAIKYSPPGTPITLKAFARQSMYYVQIIDHGPGISNKYHEAAFEKFFRVPGYDHYSVKGLGLGLFIARETCMKINSSLLISNVHPTGCMFTLTLPI